MSSGGLLNIGDFLTIGDIVLSTVAEPPLMQENPEVFIDSREVTVGSVFVALKGERTDGHAHIAQAFERGAKFVMVSRAWYGQQHGTETEPPSGCGFLVCDDPVAGLQWLAARYRDTFAIPIVAIGGSNGKTTTKEMVTALLSTVFRVVTNRGNQNNHIGVPLTLLRLRRDTGIAVVEMGINHPGEMLQLAGMVRPTHGLLTNIGHEHLEYLMDLDGVAAEETLLFRFLQEHGSIAFVNHADPFLRKAGELVERTVGYDDRGCEAQGFRIESAAMAPDGYLSFRLVGTEGEELVTMQFTGRHNVQNAIAAMSVARYFGVSFSRIRKGFMALVPQTGWKRLEVSEVAGVRLINDTYNANSDSMRMAVATLRDMPGAGRRIAVLAEMLELGTAAGEEHRRIGRYLRENPVAMLYTFGQNAALIGEAAGSELPQRHFQHEPDLIEALTGVVQSGDIVLFKGSRGMKLERIADALRHYLSSTVTG